MSEPFQSLRHVIIGAGEAGTRAALTLRERGAQNITLIGDEPGLPYERPPLSKPEGEAVVIRPIATDFSGIHTRFGQRATAIDRSRQQVLTQGGEAVPYDRLLLATGAQPRNPWAVPVLRRHDHATSIFDSIRPNARAIVVGAGLIGLELAAEFARRGAEVTVVEAAPTALGRAVPSDLAKVLVDRHQAEGVKIVFSARLSEVTRTCVLLDDGQAFDADLVVAAVGAVPDTALAEAAGLKCGNGIHVDAGLATDDPAIFAVGDCAAVDHGLYGRTRFETWRNARDQGIVAASAMLGEPVQFNALPWFWSDQYDLGLQMVGLHDPSRNCIRRPLDGGFLRLETDTDGRLAAAGGVASGRTAAKEIRIAEMIIASGQPVDIEALSDPDRTLRSFLRR